MLSATAITRISKFLSLVLRHKPDELGIALDDGGWTDVAQLLQRMQQKGFDIDEPSLHEVVAANNKQRFAFSADGRRIRASQGHSIPVNLGYAPQQPPRILYHGTAAANLQAILQQGLHKGSRHQVHLSTDEATAITVGRRHGAPVVVQVDAARMYADGYAFYCSDNVVWLTEWVPAVYLHPIAH
ncbi:putative RNA 2'-phosphotransferase [Cnuella takakiae]|uniref:Probable RNA 2'-phosphotransferase n=1 Tax=Cnuella takakiae TaxID=1302690 RepID=A0A1M4TGE0_9BACT|nr:RNA 2'-phosphotransferase [Cnuella takakiae]OLY90735.1 RNA 2'-phosphotransferase [Cnuella takakiae]SHE43550.1 putative RNA 2'-phosphotransferase [Cnuella takakiae]